MLRGLPPDLHRRLLKALNGRSAEDADIDELSSVLLQITLAIMLIFMIAFFLFMSKVGGEISRVEELKNKVANAEREKIIQVAEQVAEHYRIRYGLKDFLRIDPITGAKSYEFSGVIDNGNVDKAGFAARSFRAGAAAAAGDYADPAALEKAWIEKIREIAGEAAGRDRNFVAETVHERVTRLRREAVEVQTLAAATIQQYFARHPDRLDDPAIRRLIGRINAEPDSPDRPARLAELDLKLRRYIYDRLTAQCGAPMLEEK